MTSCARATEKCFSRDIYDRASLASCRSYDCMFDKHWAYLRLGCCNYRLTRISSRSNCGHRLEGILDEDYFCHQSERWSRKNHDGC